MTRPAAFLVWALDTFGPVAADPSERARRFVEEALELAQAMGLGAEDIAALVSRVWSRPAGDAAKEIGQTQACLETLAESLGLSADALAEAEFDRVRSIPKSEWYRRHNAKVAAGLASWTAGLSPAEDHADSLGSWNAALEVLGERVRAGAPVPEFMLSRKAKP